MINFFLTNYKNIILQKMKLKKKSQIDAYNKLVVRRTINDFQKVDHVKWWLIICACLFYQEFLNLIRLFKSFSSFDLIIHDNFCFTTFLLV